MWLVILGSIAGAQQVVDGSIPPLNAQLFRPSLDSQYTLWTNDSTRHANNYLMGRLVAHYTKNPLTYHSDQDSITRVLSDVIQLDAMAGYQIGPVRVGLIMPLYLYADGENRPSEAGFGDLTLDLKTTILNRDKHDIGFALGGRVGFPTGSTVSPLHSRAITYEIEAIIDRELGEKAFIAGNIGYKGVPRIELENFVYDDSIYARLGLGYRATDRAGLSADLVSHGIPGALGERGALPVELMLSGYTRAARDLRLQGGIGTALTKGLGAPQFRLIFSMSFEPSTDPDQDHDGVIDAQDACRSVPEDLDGIADLDGCPEPTPVTVQIVDTNGTPISDATYAITGLKNISGAPGTIAPLFGGDYAVTAEAGGYLKQTQSITIPDAASHEIKITLERRVLPGTLTVEVTDREGNPIPGATWSTVSGKFTDQPVGEAIQIHPSNYALRVSAEGYRGRGIRARVIEGASRVVKVELSPAKAKLVGEQITIDESIFFELNRAVIETKSLALIDEIADILLDHHEITKIRIEGHTDNRGDASKNKELSQARANAVREAMISRGVEEGRLEAVGFGEEKPLDPANNEAAWAKNRRVDFFVAGRADAHTE